jgi:hypothetical protein
MFKELIQIQQAIALISGVCNLSNRINTSKKDISPAAP